MTMTMTMPLWIDSSVQRASRKCLIGFNCDFLIINSIKKLFDTMINKTLLFVVLDFFFFCNYHNCFTTFNALSLSLLIRISIRLQINR